MDYAQKMYAPAASSSDFSDSDELARIAEERIGKRQKLEQKFRSGSGPAVRFGTFPTFVGLQSEFPVEFEVDLNGFSAEHIGVQLLLIASSGAVKRLVVQPISKSSDGERLGFMTHVSLNETGRHVVKARILPKDLGIWPSQDAANRLIKVFQAPGSCCLLFVGCSDWKEMQERRE